MSTFGDVEKFSGPVQVNEVEINKLTTKKQLGENKSINNVKGIIRPVFPWNDRSHKSFKEVEATGVSMNGKDSFWTGFDFNRDVMSSFMKIADLRKGPVKHLIHNMKRLRAKEIDPETGEQTGKTKEYLTFVIRHEGKDWLGSRIASPEVSEGRYQKWKTEVQTIGYDSRTGEPQIETGLTNPVIVYYIPWEGRKTVEKILKIYPGSEDSLDECLFYAEYGGHGRDGTKERCNLYTYEQFVNSEFEHLEWLGRRPGGPTGRNQLGVNADKALYAACSCKKCQSPGLSK